MTTSTPPGNTVLVLYPPKVNGQTEPVEGAHIGVPLVAYDLVTDGEGAVVLVDPPLSGTMDPGDVMELWLENEAAALDSETIVDPDARTTLRIPKARLHPDKVNMLYYTVRRGSSNIGTSTPPLEILYNRIRPGLKDRLTDPGGHSELKLLLPEVIKNGVGADFVSAEVCVAYPYCRAYDVISLKCNGELLEPKPKVNPNLAPQPPNPGDETPITICFTVTRAFLDKAKRQDKKLHFSYTVTDQIGNGPDTDAPWSPVQSVDEDLDGTRLPMPILLERKEDYPGDDASIIDLEKLAGNPLLLVVITKDNRFAVGDEIVATYTTTGQTDPVVVRGKVEEDPFIGKLPCFLEVPNDKVFAGSKVTAVYEVHRPNVGLVGNSSTANATVTDAPPIDLRPEITSVTDSQNKEIPNNGGTVDPQVKLSGTATPLQRVEVFEGNTSKGKWPVNAASEWTYETTLSGIGTRTFTAKADYGKGQISADRTFTLSNALTPAIDSVKDSGGVEIPDNGYTSDTTIKLSGTATPRLEVEIYDGAVAIGTAQVNGNTGRWELEVPGLSLTTHSFKAKALYGTGAESEARTLTVTAGTAPTLTSVKGSPSGNEIPQNGTTFETAVTLSGAAAKGQKVEIFDGAISRGIADVNGSGTWTRLVTGLAVESHSFKAKALYGNGQESEPHTLIVLPELQLPPTPVTLSGARYYFAENSPWGGSFFFPVNPNLNTFIDRPATGGKPPYSYVSSDREIAAVRQDGRVMARGNGTATITVTDSNAQSKSYVVTTSGRAQPVYYGGHTDWQTATNSAAANGGRLFTLSEFQNIYRNLVPAITKSYHSMTSTRIEADFWLIYFNGERRRAYVSPGYQAGYFYIKF